MIFFMSRDLSERFLCEKMQAVGFAQFENGCEMWKYFLYLPRTDENVLPWKKYLFIFSIRAPFKAGIFFYSGDPDFILFFLCSLRKICIFLQIFLLF